MNVLVGSVPSVWIAPVGKSGSASLILETAEPTGTFAVQFPWLSVITVDT